MGATMRVLRLLLEISSFVVLRSAAQDCEDPELCKWVGVGLCVTNPVVSKQCKKKCGYCDVEINCPKIVTAEHVDIRTSSRPPYRVGTIANFTCHPGLKRIGPSTIMCLSTGRWSNLAPYCTARRCRRDLSKVEEGRQCWKTCKTDSDCKGSRKKCKCDDWCGKSCFNPDVNCPQLLKPNNGYVIANGWSYGKTVTYICDKGNTLTSPSIRRCRSDRKWSGSSPLCVPYGACGQNSDNRISWSDGKVTNGNNAREGAWPWQVLLTQNNDYSVDQIYRSSSGFAGGSIINEEWILSAAHVFTSVFRQSLKVNIWNNTFLLVAGMTKYPKSGLAIPEHIQIFTPRSVHIHPRFRRLSFDYDVALIRIGQKMQRSPSNLFVPDKSNPRNEIIFSRFVRPVCLPCMKRDLYEPVDVLENYDKLQCNGGKPILSLYAAVGSSVMLTGFGKKEDGTEINPANNLQQGLVKILDDLSCRDSVQDIKRHNNNLRYTSRMFCASGGNKTANIDSCKGDSGGPVVKRINGNKNTYWMQVGIVSWGIKCGGKHPGFYTSLPTVMPWVWKTLHDARNGRWSDWSSWEECSVTCGTGNTRRLRSCQGPEKCDGNTLDTRACNKEECPGRWNEWSSWEECSVTCGRGNTKRIRSCQGPGKCGGKNIEAEICQMEDCTDCKDKSIICTTLRAKAGCNDVVISQHCPYSCGKCKPATAEWSDWTVWTECSKTCGGGTQDRSRTCSETSSKCIRLFSVSRGCNTQKCGATKMKRDVLFLIQAGCSVRSTQLERLLRLTKAIINYLCDALIGENRTRISVHTFDAVQRTHVRFNEFLSKVELLKKIESIRHNSTTDGFCCLNKSLEYAANNLFTLRRGARMDDEDTYKQIFLLSGGRDYCEFDTTAKALHNFNGDLADRRISLMTFLVGRGRNADIGVLQSLSEAGVCYQSYYLNSWVEVGLAINGFETTECVSNWDDSNLDECDVQMSQ